MSCEYLTADDDGSMKTAYWDKVLRGNAFSWKGSTS